MPSVALREQLLALLRTTPQTPREVLAHFNPGQASTVTEQLRELVELGELRYASDGRLS